MGDWWNPFDDEPGAGLGGALGITHPSNPAATYGKPRAGTGPNYNDYLLGGSPDYLNALQGTANNIGSQGATLSNAAPGMINAGTDAQNRMGPATMYDPRMQGALGMSGQASAAQYGLSNELRNVANRAPGQSAATGLEAFAAGGPGPSAAQAQLQSGTNQALNSQLAMARSGSGFGESANAIQAAQGNAAGIMANNANQASQTAANENQAFQQARLAALSGAGNIRQGEAAQNQNAQLQALGLSGQQLDAARGQDAALANIYSQQGQFLTNTELQQRQMNDAQQLGMYGAGTNMANVGMQNQIQAQNLGLEGAKAQQAGTMGYNTNLTDIYGIDTGEHDKTRELNQSAGQAGIGAVGGLISAAAPALAMLSDRRSKKKIRRISLDEHYAAIAGGLPGAPL